MMVEIKVARSHKCIARASITWIKRHIIKLEETPELLNANRKTVQSLKEKVQPLEDAFKKHHFVIPDQAEDPAIIAEQEVLDENEDKVVLYTSQLQLLE